MATYPNYLSLNVPLVGDNFDLAAWNDNMDKINGFAGERIETKTLFNGSVATGVVALNDSAANFSRLLITSIDNDNNTQPDTIAVNGKTTNINTVDVKADGKAYIKSAIVNVNGTAITFVSNRESYNGVISGSNVIKITKVVGERLRSAIPR